MKSGTGPASAYARRSSDRAAGSSRASRKRYEVVRQHRLAVLSVTCADDLMRPLLRVLSVLAALAISAGAVQAHPHVWVEAASELIFAADGSMTGVRHAWIFDDMFSTYALQGIKAKKKGVYTREELAPLAQTNMESLKEFAFFTFARAA